MRKPGSNSTEVGASFWILRGFFNVLWILTDSFEFFDWNYSGFFGFIWVRWFIWLLASEGYNKVPMFFFLFLGSKGSASLEFCFLGSNFCWMQIDSRIQISLRLILCASTWLQLIFCYICISVSSCLGGTVKLNHANMP